MNKLVLTWANFEQWMQELVPVLRSQGEVTAVYGPARGGLVPAVTLSHRLGIKYLQNIAELELHLASGGGHRQILWVDEIVDSGRTLEQWIAAYPGTICAAWCARPEMITKFPWLKVHLVPDAADWLVFPWEDRCSWEQDQKDYQSRRAE